MLYLTQLMKCFHKVLSSDSQLPHKNAVNCISPILTLWKWRQQDGSLGACWPAHLGELPWLGSSSKTKAENVGESIQHDFWSTIIFIIRTHMYSYTNTEQNLSAFAMHPEHSSGDSHALLIKGSAMALRGVFKFSCVS